MKILGLAFPGNLSQSVCGTSFSTPRVAWLLAAREVLSGKTLAANDQEGVDAWISAKEAIILGLQRASSQFIEKYTFDVESLLGVAQEE